MLFFVSFGGGGGWIFVFFCNFYEINSSQDFFGIAQILVLMVRGTADAIVASAFLGCPTAIPILLAMCASWQEREREKAFVLSSRFPSICCW